MGLPSRFSRTPSQHDGHRDQTLQQVLFRGCPGLRHGSPGLHRLQGRQRLLPAPLRWAVAEEALQEGSVPFVERMTNSLMMHGRNNGKKLLAVRVMRHVCDIIHLLTGENPVQVITDAVVNSGPREDSCRIGSAGVVRRQAIDVSPLRRVNQAIWLLTTGARESAFRNIKTIAECLAEEIINAAKGSSNSYAIKKKDEIERVAKANR